MHSHVFTYLNLYLTLTDGATLWPLLPLSTNESKRKTTKYQWLPPFNTANSPPDFITWYYIKSHKFTLTLKFFTAILKLSRHLTVFLYHLLHTLDQLFKFSCSITKMFIVMLIKKNFFQTSICLKTCHLTITAISNHR